MGEDFRLYYVDTEVSISDKKVQDIGVISNNNAILHSHAISEFKKFIADADFVCGHNVIHHDLKYLYGEGETYSFRVVDTLYLSPLLFPKRPYHKLLKDDKLLSDELNNPVNDCEKARELLEAEKEAFCNLPISIQAIYYSLLHDKEEFSGFFQLLHYHSIVTDLADQIVSIYGSHICVNKDVNSLIRKYPIELAYALALIGTEDFTSLTPPWLLRNYPKIENIVGYLCNSSCSEGCPYCQDKLDIHTGLKRIFGYSAFRTFDGEPMQERAVQSAVNGESLLTIFPTGGGKSLTFQLPAILSGRAVHGLTVIISPLQSLMKDQVDNLNERGIIEAVTINGLLDPISRADAFNRVASGLATMLYISPEMLRSRTIEKLLLSRNVVRFVIDEAHCFSAWGQDFRVDYLFIGDFIRQLQEKKGLLNPIPVSCFTATAKQKVITDISDYFEQKLQLKLNLFASTSNRKNLKYSVIYAESEEEKYSQLRRLVSGYNCPTIVYVSRTQKTIDIAKKLTSDGFQALPFHGKMDPSDKIFNQNEFISNNVRIIVATSAFGMGVDKKDVGLVIHYEISDSLENYVQEAGRAGRNPEIEADCFVLYSDKDLDKHFILLNQTKLSISEIQQVWSAIKGFTKQRKAVSCSALEIARAAGWDDTVSDIETRVRTSIAALESAGYVSRGNNVPHVYATGIMVRNMDEASQRITKSELFDNEGKQNAIRIIKSLISKRSIAGAVGDDAESRVDYLADILGMTKESVISAINRMRQEGILADSQDMSAYLDKTDTENRSKNIFTLFSRLERFILNHVPVDGLEVSYKKLNEAAMDEDIKGSTIKNIRTILYFLTVKGYIKKKEDINNDNLKIMLTQGHDNIMKKHEDRMKLCSFLISEFYRIDNSRPTEEKERPILFSLLGMLQKYQRELATDLFSHNEAVGIDDMEDALLYLSKIGALKLDGGFMVIYNAMEIKRLVDSKYRYKIDDYRILDEFYKQKIRQVHIVGEYANLMVRDYDAALAYVQDYFQMDFKKFIKKYFEGQRAEEIEKNITPAYYKKLFGDLSDCQKAIIGDKDSKYIVVAAGPGSGKTKVLVHKLASLLLMEDVKHEQLLMLTFSRAAATEFKKRLIVLIGNAARFVEIKTFHSYCFDLIGKVGNIDDSQDVVKRATQMIEQGEVEQGRINKAVLVIDEAQDMDESEFALVRALMQNNEEMRVIAVGDDDQNIYQFRGADSKYMRQMLDEMQAAKYEMTANYRSVKPIVELANSVVKKIGDRMKSEPIVSMRSESGSVVITQHLSSNMETAIANHVKKTYQGESACVLTRTNEEALRLVCLLNKHGLNAKLIQSMDGFRFSDLAEIRYFKKVIDCNQKSPIISDEAWKKAKESVLSQYGDSDTGDMLRLFISEFEQTNKVKYRSDLEDYISESKVEDFSQLGGNKLYVSTIHKTKGKEFDTVYLMLVDEVGATDEELRSLYVALTRAKNNLYIHTNTSFFAPYQSLCTSYVRDNYSYSEPEEIMFQLSHKDVYLDFFKGKKKEIFQLRSGDELLFVENELRDRMGNSIVRLSSKARTQLETAEKKGYYVTSSKVRFVVAWKGKDDTEMSAVVLPDLYLKKT